MYSLRWITQPRRLPMFFEEISREKEGMVTRQTAMLRVLWCGS